MKEVEIGKCYPPKEANEFIENEEIIVDSFKLNTFDHLTAGVSITITINGQTYDFSGVVLALRRYKK